MNELPLMRLIKPSKPKKPKRVKPVLHCPDGSVCLKEQYQHLNKPQKQAAYVKTYYNASGHLYHAIRNRSRRFEIPKEELCECSTMNELDTKVNEILLSRGYPANIIGMIWNRRKSRRPACQ